MSETSAFVIKGLGGKKELEGEVKISGAKNAALKALAASLLFEGEVVLKNVPVIEDIKRIAELIESLGVSIVKSKKESVYTINVPKKVDTALCPNISKKIRASVVLTGPLLAREGKVVFPHPGGCLIGERPIDFFLEGFKKMGATIVLTDKAYEVTAPNGGLKGVTHFLRTPSVTVTETLMMAGVRAVGETVIKNAALEPEIGHLAEYLNACGARITGMGTPTLKIKGVTKVLKAKKVVYTTPADRIEAGSYIILAALAAKDVTIKGCNPDHFGALIETLRYSGVQMTIGKSSVRITCKGQEENKQFKSVAIKTLGYPGFPTDLQSLMTVFLTQTKGLVLVHETIWEGRFGYVESLQSMGANISVMDPHRVMVKGPKQLHGKNMEGPDMRAGLAFIIAAIVAKGTSKITNTYIIERGYELVDKKLAGLGVSIERV